MRGDKRKANDNGGDDSKDGKDDSDHSVIKGDQGQARGSEPAKHARKE